MNLERVIFLCGLAQFTILVASVQVPHQLRWKEELACLSKLHRQMYWTYACYVVLNICAFGLLSTFNSQELASGSRLARGFCAYVAVFWGVRILLQGVFDSKPYLKTWWLKAGYHLLTLLFCVFTVCYAYGALWRQS